MILLMLLYIVSCFFFPNNAQYSPMGTEKSFRENIEKLKQGKLQFSNDLPFDSNELSDYTPKNQSDFDFIIIGAGTAGSTIAARLSEIQSVTVLLIEAGGREYSIMDVPSMVLPLQFSNEINWNYETEKSDKYCLGLEHQKCKWPRGKVMGGSSTINYMLATRANRRDYDEWANVTGDGSWSYKSMLTYLKKLENFQVKNLPVDIAYHGKNGPIPVSGPKQKTTLTSAFIQAGKELGYSEVDYNGFEQTGFAFYQSLMNEGERWSNNRAYLRPAKARNNLFVTQYSHVHKVLIDKTKKSAYGVRYSKNNVVYEVKAKKKIILSAGTVNSPQILMLSGVGPSQHLRNLNIDVVKDAPVGENLFDHFGYPGLAFTTSDATSSNDWSLIELEDQEIKDYLKSRTGPLASGLNLGGIAYVNVDDASDPRPNLEFLFNLSSGLRDPLIAAALGISLKYPKKMSADELSSGAWMIWPMLIKPRSHGKILLGSSNPFDKPKIYPNYLEDPHDVQVLIKGIRMAIKLSKTKAFQKYNSKMDEIPLPCQNHKTDSDEYWECAIRNYGVTIYHPVGTCKMGRENDRSSVVDPHLNVIGVKGLSVVDASIIPNMVGGHTNIPVNAIAEKASDMIKKEYRF